MSTKTELLLCPFCGGAPEVVKRDVEPQGDAWYSGNVAVFVECGCGACLFDGGFHTGFNDGGGEPRARAIAAWNRRASQAAEPSAVPDVCQYEDVPKMWNTSHADAYKHGWDRCRAEMLHLIDAKVEG